MSEQSDHILFDMGFRRISPLEASVGVDWVFDGLIPRESVVVLAGESGIGKSTLIFDLITALATTTPFAGHAYGRNNEGRYQAQDGRLTDILRPAGAIYIYGEGEASLDSRIVAAYEARKATYAATYPYVFDYLSAQELPILKKKIISAGSDGPQSLRATIKDIFEKEAHFKIRESLDASIGLIVVDTLAVTAGITNGNDNGMVQDRINSFKELADWFGAALVITAHTKKGTTDIIGATTLFNNADVVLRIARHGSKSGILSLVNDKARHGPKQPDKQFRLVPFSGDESLVGVDTVPLVVEWLDQYDSKQTQGVTRVTDSKNVDSHPVTQRDNDPSGFEVYMNAVRLAVMGQGNLDAAGLLWTTLADVRSLFEGTYGRSAEANRKAFERAHNRAVSEGKVVVCVVDGVRQLVRVVE